MREQQHPFPISEDFFYYKISKQEIVLLAKIS